MVVKKIKKGLYQVRTKGQTFEVENMREWGQDWKITDEDGEWIQSFATKKQCIDWLIKNIK